MSYFGINNIIENNTSDNERLVKHTLSINSSLNGNNIECRNIIHQQPYHHESMYITQPQLRVSTSSMRYPENYLMEKSNVQLDNGCYYDCRCSNRIAPNFNSHSSVTSPLHDTCTASTSASSSLINQYNAVTCCQKRQEDPYPITESKNSVDEDNVAKNDVPVPNWLKVYIGSDMQHDQKIIWEMFNIRDLYSYNEDIEKLYHLHVQETKSYYKQYEVMLHQKIEEIENRLLCEANQRGY